jgi:peptide chain release factor subunit 1
LGHAARESVKADIERIEQAAGEDWQPGAAAIFTCSGAGFFEEVRLPRHLHDRVVVDATPWVRPMIAVLDELHRALVVIVERKEAWLYEVYQDEIRRLDRVRDRALRDPNYAGWGGYEEHNVHQKARELEKRHFQKVADEVRRLIDGGGFEIIVLGGHEEEFDPFRRTLHESIRGRVAGEFPIDPDTATNEDIRRGAAAVIERYERDEERRLVTEVMDLAAAGPFGALGLDDCLWAASANAIEQLLAQDGVMEPGIVCDRDHWLARSGETCPIGGEPTRRTPDVIDEMVEAVMAEGGSIEHVVADTPLRRHVTAARLRFPLPPRP